MSAGPSVVQASLGLAATVREAMQRLDSSGRRLLVVVDGAGRMVGVVTDGDVRRFILRGGNLAEPVAAICNRSPRKVVAGTPRDEIRRLMAEHRIMALPEVDAEDRPIEIHSWEEALQETPSVPRARTPLTDATVVIMAGGMGTRLDPLTRILPKALVPVGEKPMIEHILERFRAHGVAEFHLVLHHKAEFVRTFFQSMADPGYRTVFHTEPQPMGTIGGLGLFDPATLASDVFVSNCDILVDADYGAVLEYHRGRKAELTLVGATRRLQVAYGVLRLDPRGDLASIEEKPGFEFLINSGLYVLRRELLAEIPRGAASHITDLMARLLEAGRKVAVFPVPEGAWMDVGEWPEYDRTSTRLGK